MTQALSGQAQSIRLTLPLCRSGLAAGTGVMTADGEIPVEFLEPGDKLVTWDAGLVRLARISARNLARREVLRVRPGALSLADDRAPARPASGPTPRDVLISARQQVLLRGWQARAMFGKRAALVEAGRLVDGEFITRETGEGTLRLYQLLFEGGQHIVALAGAAIMATSARLPTPARV